MRRIFAQLAGPGAVLALLAACAPVSGPLEPVAPRNFTPMEQALIDHVSVLAADDFGGREAGTKGERLTLDYLETRLAAAGLRSGTHDPRNPWREPFAYERLGQEIATHNLIGRLPGSEPQAGAVLLIAHWDHLGQGRRCRRKGDDAICNGAIDNATGLAMMIEIARMLASGPPLRRDIYFLASGGEEDGLRGAAAFVADPPVPLDKFAAVFNLDTEGLAPAGSPAVVLAVSDKPGFAALRALIEDTARDKGVTLLAPTRTNLRFLKRQDAWVFAASGIPGAIVSAAFADEKRLKAYLRHRYHRANDEIEGVEPGAAADMARFHVALLTRAADPDFLPRSGGSVDTAAIPANAH